jgi:hypothetical protein
MTKTGFGILNFGHCDLFGICDLLFGTFSLSNTPTLQYSKTAEHVYRQSHSDLTWPKGLGFLCPNKKL